VKGGGTVTVDASSVKNLGYYYTDWIWQDRSTDFMKSMLLFFDGLTLALPSDLAAEVIERDPLLAGLLAERGLLVNFDPATTLDAATAEQLARALTACVKQFPDRVLRGEPQSITGTHLGASGTITGAHWGFDAGGPVSPVLQREMQTITGGHFGSFAERDTQAVDAFQRLLTKRGLISPDTRSGLYRMSHGVRSLILAFFAQALRMQLDAQGIVLHLATDDRSVADGTTKQLETYLRGVANTAQRGQATRKAKRYWKSFSRADAISPAQLENDLHDVGADLAAVPLDEVLGFRAEHGRHYQAYAKGLRELLVMRAQASPAEQRQLLEERRREIKDQVADLQRISRRAFGIRAGTLLVSLAGAAWTVHTGDPVGAMLAAAAAGAQTIPLEGETVTAYSYLIQARKLGQR
jgi:hypothetical protein